MDKDERNALIGILFLLCLGLVVRAAGWFQAPVSFAAVEVPEAGALNKDSGATLRIARSDSGDARSGMQERGTRSTPSGKASQTARHRAVQSAKLRVGERINPDTAGAATLARLPGVGPALARRIIAYRDVHGPFRTPEALGRVKGIGKTKLTKMLPMLVFD